MIVTINQYLLVDRILNPHPEEHHEHNGANKLKHSDFVRRFPIHFTHLPLITFPLCITGVEFIIRPAVKKTHPIKKRKHCSRMRTARLPTLCASVATRCQHWQWGGPKWTKVWTGLISSLCHQMSLAGGVPCTVRSYVQGSGVGHGSLYSEVLCREGASLYSDVQCIMGNGHIDPPKTGADTWCLLVRSNASWVMVSWDPPTEQTDRHDWKHYFPTTSLPGDNYGLA